MDYETLNQQPLPEESEGGTPTNHAVDLKAIRKTFSSIGFRYLVGSLLIFLAQVIVVGVVRAFWPEWLSNTTISLIISVLPMYLIAMPIMIWLVKRGPGTAPERHSIRPGQFVIALIMCFSVMYLSNIVGTILTTIIGAIKGTAVENTVQTVVLDSNMGVIFLYMVIIAPIMEEYIFRKLLVDRILVYGEGVAIVMSGLMFGLFHGNLNQFIYAFALGMFLAFLYVKTGDLRITIALHMCVNFVGSIVSVLVVQGIHLEEYYAIMENGADVEAIMAYVMEYLGGWICYAIYLVALVAVVIGGAVLLIVRRKQFAVGPSVIEKGSRFKTVICNPGMICYCILWIGTILLQLFMEG